MRKKHGDRPRKTPLFSGSSPDSGERLAYFEEEVLIVMVSVGDPFEYFDFVVDAFKEAGVEGIPAVRDDAVDVGFEPAHEDFERADSAADARRPAWRAYAAISIFTTGC